ncbi:MAG: hypothetical protein AAF652_14070 [Cyanobacteria bacterium P01_C01_bin.72]
MNEIPWESVNLPHKAKQILCLDYEGNCLYGELIQLIPQRQLCWLRPLCLVISASVDSDIFTPSKSGTFPESINSSSSDENVVIDLRSGADLLWPASLFRPALDTEIINLIPHLKDISHYSSVKKSGQKCLNKFMQLVWQAHQDKF